MKGQMIYTPKNKSWEHIPSGKMTALSCQKDNSIQSRAGYFRASVGELSNSGSLEEMILWIETKNK